MVHMLKCSVARFYPSEGQICPLTLQHEPDCEWYSFNLEVDYCLLTSTCIPKNTSTDHVFGQKSCFEEISTNVTDPSKII